MIDKTVPDTFSFPYTYDHENLMISRSLDADGAGSGTADTTTFVNDGNQIVLMFYKATPGGSLALVDRLLWGPEVDQLLSDERVTSLSSAGTVYWSLPDHLGTVIDVATYNSGTDTTTIAKHRGFDGFGNITSDSATGVIFVIGYTGKYLDSATGLQNNINRWYAAALGEWMTEDPIGFKGGDENLARYVHNGPLTATDPLGLEIVTTIIRYSDNGTIDAFRDLIDGLPADTAAALRAVQNHVSQRIQRLGSTSHTGSASCPAGMISLGLRRISHTSHSETVRDRWTYYLYKHRVREHEEWGWASTFSRVPIDAFEVTPLNVNVRLTKTTIVDKYDSICAPRPRLPRLPFRRFSQ